MTDTMTRIQRSQCMSRIKSKNTGPEIAVRRIVHRLGCRFRLEPQRLPGSPDIILTRHRAVIFVHGCFWHRHKNCRFAYMPKSRKVFWRRKFEENVRRDRRAMQKLGKLGWNALVIWECQVSDPDWLRCQINGFLSKGNSRAAGFGAIAGKNK